MSRATKFAAESRKFAQACRAEHEALGLLLERIEGVTLFPEQTEARAAAEEAHHAVDLQLGVTVQARAKATGKSGHPSTDDDMSRASLGRDAHQAD